MEHNKSSVKSTQDQDLQVLTNVKDLISLFQSRHRSVSNDTELSTNVEQQSRNDKPLLANSMTVEKMQSELKQMFALVGKSQAENEGLIKQLKAENLELRSEKKLYGEKDKRLGVYESLIKNLKAKCSENADAIKKLQTECNVKDLQLAEKEHLIARLEAKCDEKNYQMSKTLNKLEDLEGTRDENCLVETLEKHAKVCYDQKQYVESLLHCESAIALEKSAQNRLPVLARLLSNKAGCYLCLKQPHQAIEAATLSINYDSNCKEAFQNRAGAFFELEQYTNALQDLEAAQQLDPACKKIHNLLDLVRERITAKE